METIPQVIKSYLGTRPPDSLRLAVTAVFLKPKESLKNWQTGIMSNLKGPEVTAHYVDRKFRPAILNAMILCHLIGNSGKVREFFEASIRGNSKKNDQKISTIRDRYESHFSEFFCLGIVPETLNQIVAQLQDPNWNPLTQELSCPFKEGSFRPLALLYGKLIPWTEYHAKYDQAYKMYQSGQLEEAEKLLSNLESSAIVRLPIATSLRQQLQSKLNASESYFNYLQKNL